MNCSLIIRLLMLKADIALKLTLFMRVFSIDSYVLNHSQYGLAKVIFLTCEFLKVFYFI